MDFGQILPTAYSLPYSYADIITQLLHLLALSYVTCRTTTRKRSGAHAATGNKRAPHAYRLSIHCAFSPLVLRRNVGGRDGLRGDCRLPDHHHPATHRETHRAEHLYDRQTRPVGLQAL